MVSKKKEILGQTGVYLWGTFLTQGITLAATLLTRRFLGPLQMGVWSLLQVVIKYSSYSTLGTVAATSREIPFYKGKGDLERVAEIQNTFFTYGVGSSIIIAVLMMISAVFLRSHLRPELFWGLLWTGGLLVLQRFNNILITLLRAHKNFSLISKQMVVSAIVNAVLMAYLSYRFKIYGYIWGMCLSFAFNIAYMMWNEKFDLRWHFNLAEFRSLAVYGMPLTVIGLMNTGFMSIDRFMIAGYLGLKAVGLYGIAALASTFLASAPNAISVVLIPNFHEKYGKEEKELALKGYTAKSTTVFSDVMPVAIGGSWIFCGFFVALLLPDFVDSIPAIKFLLLSSFFLAVSQPYNTFVIAIKKHWLLVPVLGVASLAAFGLNYLSIRAGFGIAGVAAAATAVMFVRFTANFIIAAKRLFTRREAWEHYLTVMAKFVFMTALLLGLDRWLPATNRSLPRIFLQGAIFTVLYLPVLWKFDREFEVLASFRQKFFKQAVA